MLLFYLFDMQSGETKIILYGMKDSIEDVESKDEVR